MFDGIKGVGTRDDKFAESAARPKGNAGNSPYCRIKAIGEIKGSSESV
jgi:hypothetical protein